MRSAVIGAALIALAVTAPAAAGDHGGKGGHLVPKRIWCPRCAAPCEPTVTKGKETRSCWEVETKTICVPRVTFPWEARACGAGKKSGCKSGCKGCSGKGGKDLCGPAPDCTPAKCGRTKCVNVLMKREYECTVCKYNWEPQKHGGKDKGVTAPADQGPAVPPPPAIEASFQRPAPVVTRQMTRQVSAEEVRTSTSSILDTIFRK